MLSGVMGLLFFSCKKDYSPEPTSENQLVVLGELIAGEMIRVPVAQSGTGNLLEFGKIKEGTVTVRENNGLTWMLKPDKSDQYDDLPVTMYTWHRKYKSNMGYSIEIDHPALGKATATTQIPGPVPVVSIDTATEFRYGREVLAASIVLQDPPEANQYVIEAVKQLVRIKRFFLYRQVKYDLDTPDGAALYERVKNEPGVVLQRDTADRYQSTRLKLYTTDPNAADQAAAKPEGPVNRIFLPDNNFNGNTYTIKLYIEKQFFTGTEPGQKGRALLQVKLASRELYTYFLTYEKYKNQTGNVPAEQLKPPTGNVENGLGVFGGASKKEFICWYDKL